MLLNCGVREDSWESLGLQGDPTSTSKELFIGRTDVEVETPILRLLDAKSWLNGKDPHAGNMRAGGERDDRGWDGWMASPTQWTWVCVDSRSWWWTGRPGVLRFMGSQRVGHNWTTELNWTELKICCFLISFFLIHMLMWIFQFQGFFEQWAPHSDLRQ